MKLISKKEIFYYETKEGKCPYIEWISQMDLKGQAILEARISRLENGNIGKVENLGDGVHELKIDFGPGIRIYFGNANDTLVIILVGGTKKCQNQDIKLAKFYWKDWKNRFSIDK